MLDGEFAAIFLGLLLLEGMRRPAEGVVVLRRVLFGPWRVMADTGAQLRMVSILPPITTSLVLLPPEPTDQCESREQIRQRWDVTRRAARPFAITGSLIGLSLVVGLPIAAIRFTGAGFLIAAGVLVLLTLVNAHFGLRTLEKLGTPREQVRRKFREWLSPFAAPGMAESMLETALRNVPPAMALQMLLPEAGLRRWLRPRAYDLLAGRVTIPDLLAAFPTAELQELVRTRPIETDSTAEAWCPRCGSSFRTTGSCSDCGVPLIV